MTNGLFITSTGTDIGKTFVTCAMLHQLFRQHVQVEAIKPVASGVVAGDPESDPARLLRAMGRPHHQSAINDICPWRYKQAVAANLAAAAQGESIPWPKLLHFCQRKLNTPSLTLVEGAGGLMSPINDTKTVIDLIQELSLPAIMVAGNYLGSISHTLTAIETLSNHRMPLVGLVICESQEPAIEQHQFEQLIFNRQMDALPLIWIPRNSDKSDAYKFVPSLETLWINSLNS